MAFISYTERPISALSWAGEAGAGLIWVDFNLVMSQEAHIRWALDSWAAQANHWHPNLYEWLSVQDIVWGYPNPFRKWLEGYKVHDWDFLSKREGIPKVYVFGSLRCYGIPMVVSIPSAKTF